MFFQLDIPEVFHLSGFQLNPIPIQRSSRFIGFHSNDNSHLAGVRRRNHIENPHAGVDGEAGGQIGLSGVA
jgi:hypothetical protein